LLNPVSPTSQLNKGKVGVRGVEWKITKAGFRWDVLTSAVKNCEESISWAHWRYLDKDHNGSLISPAMLLHKFFEGKSLVDNRRIYG